MLLGAIGTGTVAVVLGPFTDVDAAFFTVAVAEPDAMTTVDTRVVVEELAVVPT